MDRAPMSRVEVQREAEKLNVGNVLKQREHQKISRKQQTPRVQQSLKQIPSSHLHVWIRETPKKKGDQDQRRW